MKAQIRWIVWKAHATKLLGYQSREHLSVLSVSADEREVDLWRDIDPIGPGRVIRVAPAALSVGETLAEDAVKIAAELEFAVETRRAQRFIGHSRGMDGHE